MKPLILLDFLGFKLRQFRKVQCRQQPITVSLTFGQMPYSPVTRGALVSGLRLNDSPLGSKYVICLMKPHDVSEKLRNWLRPRKGPVCGNQMTWMSCTQILRFAGRSFSSAVMFQLRITFETSYRNQIWRRHQQQGSTTTLVEIGVVSLRHLSGSIRCGRLVYLNQDGPRKLPIATMRSKILCTGFLLISIPLLRASSISGTVCNVTNYPGYEVSGICVPLDENRHSFDCKGVHGFLVTGTVCEQLYGQNNNCCVTVQCEYTQGNVDGYCTSTGADCCSGKGFSDIGPECAVLPGNSFLNPINCI